MYAFCIKSSHKDGMGHYFRMVNLYKELQKVNKGVFILVGDEDPVTMNLLKVAGIPFCYIDNNLKKDGVWEIYVTKLFPDIKVWIDDRMITSIAHARCLKLLNLFFITFDDDGEGAQLSDLHIAPLLSLRKKNIFGKKIITSLRYLSLNNEILSFQRSRVSLKNIVVSLGGSDTYGVTLKIARKLSAENISATIILGPNFRNFHEILPLESDNLDFKSGVKSLCAEFSKYDLAITNAGITMFEAAAAGLPTISIANEDWEIDYGQKLASMGATFFLGHHTKIIFEAKILQNLKSETISSMSKAALGTIDCLGLRRTSELITTECKNFHRKVL